MLKPETLNPDQLDQLCQTVKNKPDRFRFIQRIPMSLDTLGDRLVRAAVDRPMEGVPFVLLDQETTGLDAQSDVAIEVGLLKCYAQFDETGRCRIAVGAGYMGLEDPGAPLSEEIKAVTGLSDEQLQGQSFDEAHIAALLADDPVLIAHNAAFDRPFFDKRFPNLSRFRWACSMRDLDWQARHGYIGRSQELLCMQAGGFYDAHRAINDVAALGWLLNRHPGMVTELLSRADTDEAMVDAHRLPFEHKEAVKSAGFEWINNTDGRGRRWRKCLVAPQVESVCQWLTSMGAQPGVLTLDHRSRFMNV